MQIVIDIADSIKGQIDDGKGEEFGIPLWLTYSIANGTVLPKGHGGLIDYDDIISEYIKRVHSYMSEEERMNLFCTIVAEAEVVIEADKEEKA